MRGFRDARTSRPPIWTPWREKGCAALNWEPKPDARPQQEYYRPIERNGRPAAVTNHLTLAFGEEAAGFIGRHKAEPWFLYLAFNAPHIPHEPTPERLARFSQIQDQQRQAYAVQVSLMDDAIGEALAALPDTGQGRRTLVFFLSDNGGPASVGPTNLARERFA